MRHIVLLIICLYPVCAHAFETTQLLDLDGTAHTLREYVDQGRWVMVNVWSPGCTHCTDELPTLVSYSRDNVNNAMVVGIAVEYPGFTYPDVSELRNFVQRNEIEFPLLLATGAQASAFVGKPVDVLPLTFAFNPQGRLVARWHGVITAPDLEEIVHDFSWAKR